MQKVIISLVVVLLLTSCARNLSNHHVVDSHIAGITIRGVIVDMRAVTISSSDSWQDNDVGVTTGAIAGGLLGSQAGGGDGAAVTAIIGAIAGAAAGSAIENHASTQQGFEYFIQTEKGQVLSVAQDASYIYNIGQEVYVVMSGRQTRIVPVR